MKLMKKYFLFVADVPVGGAFFTVFIPGILAIFFYLIYCINIGLPVANYEEAFLQGAITCVVLFILLAIVNTVVAKTKITAFKSKTNELSLFHLPGDKVEILNHSKWGKYPVTSIKFPVNWGVELKKGDENSFYMLITIIVNSEVRLFVPVTLNFIFSGPFEANDLRLKLMDDRILDEVNIDKFITEKFNSLNLSGEVFSKMTQDAKSYYNKNMSKREFIDCMQHNIKFPKLFSNVAATGVNIGKPRFNYSTLLNTETEI